MMKKLVVATLMAAAAAVSLNAVAQRATPEQKAAMKEKWDAMTPEQQAEAKKKFAAKHPKAAARMAEKQKGAASAAQ
jgi:hypothetical protein